jgi:hypothetical protein
VKKLKTAVLLFFLSGQLAFASVAMTFVSSLADVHQSFFHNLDIDHHHHGALTVHLGEDSGDANYQFFTDVLSSEDLATRPLIKIGLISKQNISVTSPLAPPDICLDSLFRPPRIVL